jgi:hypothetical protein
VALETHYWVSDVTAQRWRALSSTTAPEDGSLSAARRELP